MGDETVVRMFREFLRSELVRHHSLPVSPSSIHEAYEHVGRTMATGFFENIAWWSVALAILIGTMIGQWVLAWMLYQAMVCCRRTKGAKQASEDAHEHVPVSVEVTGRATYVTFLDDDGGGGGGGGAALRKRGGGDGIPRLLHKPVAQQGQVRFPDYVHRERDGGKWKDLIHRDHDTRRDRYMSWVRLVCLIFRMAFVTTGISLAFHVAGVNFFSLAISVGIISLVFTYGAGGLIANAFAALCIYSTDKIEMHDFIRVGVYMGFVTAFTVQHITIVNDLDPYMGRQIHHIPNKIPLATVFTQYPDGPPLKLRIAREKALAEIAKATKSGGGGGGGQAKMV